MGKDQATAKWFFGNMTFHLKAKQFDAGIFQFLPAFFLISFIAFSVNFTFAQTPEQIEYFQNRIRIGNIEVKREALFQIRNYRTATASRIAVPALRDDAEIVRATAAFSVIFLPENEAVQVLTPLLKDKSEYVRKEAAYALGEVGSPLAVNFLLQTLSRDKEIEVRDAAAVALGKIGDVSAIDELIKILNGKPKEKEEFLRRSAARSIGQIAQKVQTLEVQEATPEDFLPEKYQDFLIPRYPYLSQTFPVFLAANSVLIKSLQNPKEFADVKREAAFALGEIGSETSLPVLSGNLSAKDYYLAEIAERAVRQINFLIEYRKLLERRQN